MVDTTITDISDSITETHDAYDRITRTSLAVSETVNIIKNFTYKTNNGKTSYQISEETFSNGTTEQNTEYNYEYDALGNLTKVKESGIIKIQYTYDSLSQLIREDNTYADHSYTYEYDGNGNIKSKKTYAYTTDTLGSVEDTVTYSYGNSDWKDLLTSYDGTTISYDAYGKVKEQSYTTAATKGADYNSFRYRGYFYDKETGFYYLNSRYYDPAIGRFINADVYVSTGTGFSGYNMFAYCNDNPVMFTDPFGMEIGTSPYAGADAWQEYTDRQLEFIRSFDPYHKNDTQRGADALNELIADYCASSGLSIEAVENHILSCVEEGRPFQYYDTTFESFDKVFAGNLASTFVDKENFGLEVSAFYTASSITNNLIEDWASDCIIYNRNPGDRFKAMVVSLGADTVDCVISIAFMLAKVSGFNVGEAMISTTIYYAKQTIKLKWIGY